jgi:hypothetical protein
VTPSLKVIPLHFMCTKLVLIVDAYLELRNKCDFSAFEAMKVSK